MRREILVSKGPPRQGTKAAARNGMALQATGPSAMEGSSGHRWAIAPQNIEQFRIVLPIFKVSIPTIQRDLLTMAAGGNRGQAGAGVTGREATVEGTW